MEARAKTRGFYGWWMLFFLWIIYTIVVDFSYYSLTVLYPYMLKETGWSRGEIMVGFTIVTLLIGLVGPLTAWLIGRIGARITLFIGTIIVLLASVAMGLFGQSYTIFILLSLVIGLGISFSSVIPVQTVTVSWFNVRRALALGLVLGSSAIGGFFGPQIINAIVQATGGNWRIGWFIIAALSVVAALVAILAVRNRPEDIGQHPDGMNAAQVAERATHASRRIKTYRSPVNWSLKAATRTPSLWLLIVGLTGSFFLWMVIVSQGPLHLQDREFSPASAAFFYSLAIGFSIVGRFSIAALGDIWEPRYLFSVALLTELVGGVLFWFVLPSTIWIAYLYPMLVGFGFGASYVCMPAIISNYWGPASFPKISGLVQPFSSTLQTIAVPLAGFLYDLQGTYFTVLVIAWIITAIGIVAMLLCRPPKPKETA